MIEQRWRWDAAQAAWLLARWAALRVWGEHECHAPCVVVRSAGSEGLAVPDERPLYAYRCSTERCEEARDVLAGWGRRRDPGAGGRVFAVYAAEWWRRHYDGGFWALAAVARLQPLRGGVFRSFTSRCETPGAGGASGPSSSARASGIWARAPVRASFHFTSCRSHTRTCAVFCGGCCGRTAFTAEILLRWIAIEVPEPLIRFALGYLIDARASLFTAMAAAGGLAVFVPALQATRRNLLRDVHDAVPLARSNQELQRALQDVGST